VTSKRVNLKAATDHDLMAAVAQGDDEAFEEIVLRHQQAVWKVAYRFLGDRMEAEDVAQESFLKILEATSRYRPTATFRTYLYRILTHLCIDRARKKQLTSLDDIPEAIAPSLSPDESLIEKELQDQIHLALDALPPNQKAAMILRHYEGLSYTEIALILGVTPKAVEGLISRAGASLQARLSHL
jgi:RNA polymerase sigma-70 factor, ECF subfamily